MIGLLGLVAATFWATELGIDNVTAIRIVSASLIVFAIASGLPRDPYRQLGEAFASAMDSVETSLDSIVE